MQCYTFTTVSPVPLLVKSIDSTSLSRDNNDNCILYLCQTCTKVGNSTKGMVTVYIYIYIEHIV